MKKLISAPNIAVHNTLDEQRKKDTGRRRTDMKQDLVENYQVHNMNTLGNSMENVYSEIKDSGSMVKDQMQEQIETNHEKMLKKQKKRAEGRAQRIKEREPIMKKKREEKKAKDRAVKL